MENNKTEKSQAELYREERKERMAKAAKKNSKKSPQAEKIGHIVGKTISIVIAVLLGLVVLYGCLDFFGVPQKVLTAVKIGDEKVSVAKYNYYYMNTYLQAYNQSYSYDSQYGTGYGVMYTGYDYQKAPTEQTYPATLEGYENATWADYFKVNALQTVQAYISYASLARDAGITITEEQQAEINDQIAEITETAKENDYSLNRYITKLYGKGLDESLLREVFEEYYLALNFVTSKQEEIVNGITDEQITDEYNTNITDYTNFSISLFKVEATTPTLEETATDEEVEEANTAALAQAKASADAYMARVKDQASLKAQALAYDSTLTDASIDFDNTSYATISSNFGEAVADWAYTADRAVGDVACIEVSDGYVIACMRALPAADTSKGVDVRHILIQFQTTTDSSGNTVSLTDSEKETYYTKAQSIYNEYLATPTEENFAQLANTYSEDGGSNTTGGLYENVAQGEMVTEFNDWIFDSSRRPGDTGIIETTYGYHIMYYVNNDNDEAWSEAVKTTISNTLFTDYDTSILNSEEYQQVEKKSVINWASEQLEKTIVQQYINY